MLPAVPNLTSVGDDAAAGDARGAVARPRRTSRSRTIVIPFALHRRGDRRRHRSVGDRGEGRWSRRSIRSDQSRGAGCGRWSSRHPEDPWRHEPADIASLPQAFDEQFNAFTDMQRSRLRPRPATRPGKKAVAAFGEKGFKPLDVNELGESSAARIRRHPRRARPQVRPGRVRARTPPGRSPPSTRSRRRSENAWKQRAAPPNCCGCCSRSSRIAQRLAVIRGPRQSSSESAGRRRRDELIDALERSVTKAELTR